MIDKMVYHASSKLTRPFVDPRINQWDTILQNVKFISAIMAKYIAFALHIHWGIQNLEMLNTPLTPKALRAFEPDQLNGVTINQRTVKKVFVAVISKILSIVTGCNFLRIDQKPWFICKSQMKWYIRWRTWETKWKGGQIAWICN